MKKDLRMVMKMNKILDYKNRVLARLRAQKKQKKLKILRRNSIMQTYLKIAILGALTFGNPAKVSTSSASNKSNDNQEQIFKKMETFSLEKAKKNILENGRFFVNPENQEVLYLTNEQCKQQNIGAESTIFDICTARENGLYADSPSEERYNAYTNTKGAFYGPFQYTDANLKNALIWALCQENDQGLQDFARKMMPTPIDENNPALKAFRESYKIAQEKMKSGVSSQKALNAVYSYMSNTRNNLLKSMGLYKTTNESLDKIFQNAAKQTDFSVIKRFFDDSCIEMYMGLTSSQQNREKLSPLAASAYIMAQIHRNSKSNLGAALRNDVQSLINEHGTLGNIKSGITRMNTANKNIFKNITLDGKEHKLLDLSYYEGYTKLCHPEQLKNLLQKHDELATNLAHSQVKRDNILNNFSLDYVSKNLIQRDITKAPAHLQLTRANHNRGGREG